MSLNFIGSNGAFVGDMVRELRKKLAPMQLAAASLVDIPLKIQPNVVANTLQRMLFPHVLFSDIYNKF